MISENINLLLADDDMDDCQLFKDALAELPHQVGLTVVHDGEQLMQLLTTESDQNFNALFLDLNMPRKNGFACLEEIKSNKKLKSLFVIIFSTSSNTDIIELLYKNGAQHYICKPPSFTELKTVILQALTLVTNADKKLTHKI